MRIYFDDPDKIPEGWEYELYSGPGNEPWLFLMHPHTLQRSLDSGGTECLERGGAILFVSGSRRCGYGRDEAQKLEAEYGHRIHFLDATHTWEHPYTRLRAFLRFVEQLAPGEPISWGQLWARLYAPLEPGLVQQLRAQRADN
jgi:hypothetical protein